MAERTKAAVLKTAYGATPYVGSNPTPPATDAASSDGRCADRALSRWVLAGFASTIPRILASIDARGARLGEVIGREPELAVLQRFLDSIPSGPSALLLSGDPGIGKTTVWKEGLADALSRNYRILSCGPIEAETRLSYAALGDLLEPILARRSPVVARAPAPGARRSHSLRSPSSGARVPARGGRRPVRQRPHGGGQSQADLPQAGHPLPHGAGFQVPVPAVWIVRRVVPVTVSIGTGFGDSSGRCSL